MSQLFLYRITVSYTRSLFARFGLMAAASCPKYTESTEPQIHEGSPSLRLRMWECFIIKRVMSRMNPAGLVSQFPIE